MTLYHQNRGFSVFMQLRLSRVSWALLKLLVLSKWQIDATQRNATPAVTSL